MSSEQLFDLAKQGQLIKISTLIGSGADLSVTDIAGKTALMHAAENDRFTVVAVLLKKMNSSDINAKDNSGKTAFMYACKNGCYKTVGLLLVNKYGVDMVPTDNSGKTALDYAQACGDGKTLKLLTRKKIRSRYGADRQQRQDSP